MFTITLGNGDILPKLEHNGDYFMTKQVVERPMFEGKLYNVTITGNDFDDQPDYSVTYKFMKLMDIQDFGEGVTGFALKELTPDEVIIEGLNAKISYLAMMTDTDM